MKGDVSPMNDYENAMIFKNIMVFFSGFLLGIVGLAVLLAIGLSRIQTRSFRELSKTVSFIKIMDNDNQEHLVHNLQSFTQAFYFIFMYAISCICPKPFRLLYRKKKTEKVFFIVMSVITVISLYLAIVGIFDITYFEDDWKNISEWIYMKHHHHHHQPQHQFLNAP